MSSKRRDALKALFIPDPSDPSTAPAPEPAARQRSGAVKAMGLSLAGMTAEIADARSLRRALEDGDRVVDVDTALIDAAFVADRLSLDEGGDPAFAALVESMRGSGQQVPVLLRPHPEAPGRYQTAYGHRRIRAAARLDRPVRAIVRALSDEALVLAQGNENAERRDLSFIERALFARALVGRGVARRRVADARPRHQNEMAGRGPVA
ncbi:MAG: plasmid partitioning protein RepB, partial [Pararhizobium sp.]